MATQLKERSGASLRDRAAGLRPQPPAASRSSIASALDYHGERGDLLAKALQLLSMECDRREHRGEDISHIRSFIRAAIDEAWS